MASPDGLRLYLGSRLPPEVLENIFGYGFHLWLAEPHDAWKRVEMDYPDRFPRGLAAPFFGTTIMIVHYFGLSTGARKLINYEDYATRVKGALGVCDYGHTARPWVRHPRSNPLYLRDGNEWYLVLDCDRREWSASRFDEAQPPGLEDD